MPRIFSNLADTEFSSSNFCLSKIFIFKFDEIVSANFEGSSISLSDITISEDIFLFSLEYVLNCS